MSKLNGCTVGIPYGGHTIHVPATEELFDLLAKVELARRNLEVAEQKTDGIARRIGSYKGSAITGLCTGEEAPQLLYDEEEELWKEASICRINLEECESYLNTHIEKVLDALSIHNKV